MYKRFAYTFLTVLPIVFIVISAQQSYAKFHVQDDVQSEESDVDNILQDLTKNSEDTSQIPSNFTIDSPVEKDLYEDDEIREFPMAKIILLNKITAKYKEIILAHESIEFFANLSVKLHICLQNKSLYKNDNLMLITVYDNKIDDDRLLIFHGWVSSSNPSLSPIEHPVYEVMPQECIDDKIVSAS